MIAFAHLDTAHAFGGTAKICSEGADIVYDYEGEGPLLLMVPGAGGDARLHAALARVLRRRYLVVRHDRRCNARSTGDRNRPLDVAQHARDAAAVIEAMESGPAYVFGSGAGGAIALQLASEAPDLVRGMVVHEPLLPSLLSDAAAWQTVFGRIEAAVEAQGVGPAARLLAGVTGVRHPDAKLDIFLRRELGPFSRFVPDMALLRRNKVAMVAAAGHLNRQACEARAAVCVAGAIGCPFHTIGGGSLAFTVDPAGFAVELEALLDRVKAQPNAR